MVSEDSMVLHSIVNVQQSGDTRGVTNVQTGRPTPSKVDRVKFAGGKMVINPPKLFNHWPTQRSLT